MNFTKYGIVKEDLEKYNDLNEIKIGAKLIIPATLMRKLVYIKKYIEALSISNLGKTLY